MTEDMLKQIESRSEGRAKKALDAVGTLYEYERTIAQLIHEIRWLNNRVKGLETSVAIKINRIKELEDVNDVLSS